MIHVIAGFANSDHAVGRLPRWSGRDSDLRAVDLNSITDFGLGQAVVSLKRFRLNAAGRTVMAIGAGAQLILQTEQPDGTFECLDFTGLPLVSPVFIALSSASSPQARSPNPNSARYNPSTAI
jgi:hypothetical protein